MRFWDSSALTPLLIAEPMTEVVRELHVSDPGLVVWWGSRIECVSALRRSERDGRLDAAGVRRALELLDLLTESWSEVLPAAAVRAAAERALAVHQLRAADALQLAAAQRWREGDPAGAPLVTLDARLRDAAAREGFSTLP